MKSLISLVAATSSLCATPAFAEPCDEPITDTIAIPLIDGSLDAQHGACLRSELSATTLAHALIDTPNFHGLLGGELELGGRVALGKAWEFGARVRAIDYAFAQTAVNKVTDTSFGPVVLTVAHGGPVGERGALAVLASAELPYTRDAMETVHAAGTVDAAIALTLATHWQLHGRIGAFGLYASSDGGTLTELGFRAGVDLGWRARTTMNLLVGVETQAGRTGGLDAAIGRLGVQKRIGIRYRGTLAAGVPFAGNDHTTAILTLGVARDL